MAPSDAAPSTGVNRSRLPNLGQPHIDVGPPPLGLSHVGHTDAAKMPPEPTEDDRHHAQRSTRALTQTHYENFSVISLLLPRYLRQDFCNVYAFCRTADDAADESPDAQQALRALDDLRSQLHATYAGRPVTPMFIALGSTIQRHQIPVEPFDHLLDAFEQDQRINRYQTFAQLVDYCRRSADPVGRLVLWMCGYRDAQRQALSDRTCTALQLTNFWQDIRRDLLQRDRIYLPVESMELAGVSETRLREQIAARTCDGKTRQMIATEVQRTGRLFDEGDALLPLLDRAVRGQVALFSAGGRAVLSAIRRRNFDTLSARPSLSKWHKGSLIASAVLQRLLWARHSATLVRQPAALGPRDAGSAVAKPPAGIQA